MDLRTLAAVGRNSFEVITPKEQTGATRVTTGSLHMAKIYRERNAYQAAIIECLPLINANNRDAIALVRDIVDGREVGRALLDVIGYCKDTDNADNPATWFVLGCIYYYGLETVRNVETALDCFERAHLKELTAATTQLGVIYADIQDWQKAHYYFEHASNKGCLTALLMNEKLYRCAQQQQLLEDVEWTKGAADQGDAHAMYVTGLLYATGTGVEKDDALALKYYRDAAKNSCLKAENRILAMCLDGRAFEADIVFALHFLYAVIQQEKTSHLQEAKAKYADMAYFYANKLQQEDKRANNASHILDYYRNSTQCGHHIAPFAIGKIYQKMYISGNRSITPLEIYRYYKCAYERGHQPAANVLLTWSDKHKDVKEADFEFLMQLRPYVDQKRGANQWGSEFTSLRRRY